MRKHTEKIWKEIVYSAVVLLSLAIMGVLIAGFVSKLHDETLDNETTTHGEVYNAAPPNIEVESVVIEPIVVEPPTVPEIKTGETSFVKVGFVLVESALIESEIDICSWADIILNEEEMDLLRTTVYCEAGNQDLETQVMVALTILNRLNAGYAKDIRGVIYAPGAYAVTKWSDFEDRGWTEQVEKAVDIALSKNEHPTTMFYFRTEHYHKFQGAINYVKSGDLYFSTK